MTQIRAGMVAVIFSSTRNGMDETGYAEAADAMDRLAATQPGYVAVESIRRPDGFGLTISYWIDHASAKAWRDHPDHRRIRDAGRDRWYDDYRVVVTSVDRSYGWSR